MVELDGIGSEQTGSRPCIVISNQIACYYSPTVTIIPITSKCKKSMPTHYVLDKNKYNCFYSDVNIALCEQIRTVDKMRIKKFIGKLSMNDLNIVIDKVNNNFSIWEE